MFNVERTPSISLSIIVSLGAVDMIYAYCIFWPANMIPVVKVAILLQLFIPLNLFARFCFVGVKYYKVHLYASLLILIGIGFSPFYLEDALITKVYFLIFAISSVFDVLSHIIKEGLVRKIPLN